jgi:hypothetical protein
VPVLLPVIGTGRTIAFPSLAFPKYSEAKYSSGYLFIPFQ